MMISITCLMILKNGSFRKNMCILNKDKKECNTTIKDFEKFMDSDETFKL